MDRICSLCLESDNGVISMENVYSCGCRFDFHPHCFDIYQQNHNMCIYCRDQGLENRNNVPLPPIQRDVNFRQDWTRLMRILNRVQNRYIISFEWNDPRYLRLINHINILQNELVNLALVDNNNNEFLPN
jgi:hypothetical protein